MARAVTVPLPRPLAGMVVGASVHGLADLWHHPPRDLCLPGVRLRALGGRGGGGFAGAHVHFAPDLGPAERRPGRRAAPRGDGAPVAAFYGRARPRTAWCLAATAAGACLQDPQRAPHPALHVAGRGAHGVNGRRPRRW